VFADAEEVALAEFGRVDRLDRERATLVLWHSRRSYAIPDYLAASGIARAPTMASNQREGNVFAGLMSRRGDRVATRLAILGSIFMLLAFAASAEAKVRKISLTETAKVGQQVRLSSM